MSLQIWLPLDGTLKNQGLNPIRPTTIKDKSPTILNTAGKITSTVYGWNTDGQGIVLSDFMNTLRTYKQYTFAAWIFYTGPATNHSSTICSSGDWNQTSGQLCFGLYSYENGYKKLLTPNKSGWSQGVDLPAPLQTNTWHHITITYNGINTKAYLNGKYVGQYNGGGISTDTNVSDLYIGRATYYEGFTIKGKINDFRIYNHCLSAKEIKQLAQGLVLHYKLKDFGGKPNLLKNSYEEVSNSNYLLQTYIPETPMVAGENYVLTVCCTPSADFQYFNPHLMSGSYGGVFENGYSDGTLNKQIIKIKTNANWTYITGYTPTDNIAHSYVRLYHKPNTSACTIHWVKLEKGTTSTAWTPHRDDSIAIKDHLKEYDCSGYGNHGTKSSKLITLTSAKYMNSYNFQSGNKITNTTCNTTNWTDATISAWVKPTSFHSERSCIVIGGLYLTVDNVGAVSCYCYGKKNSSGTANEGYFSTSEKIPLNQWSHIAAVWDNVLAEVHLYINGVRKKTITNVLGPMSGHHEKKEIGIEGTSGRQFIGQISDVRIYATALDDDSINELYCLGASFIPNGIFQTGELLENAKNNIQFHKNTTTVLDNITEISNVIGMKTKMLSDSSFWARIHWIDLSKEASWFANDSEVSHCINKTNRFSRMGLAKHMKSQKISITNLLPEVNSTNFKVGTNSSAHQKYGKDTLLITGNTRSEVTSPSYASFPLNPSHKYYGRVEVYQDTINGSVDIYWPINEPRLVSANPTRVATQWSIVSQVNTRSTFTAGNYPLRLDYNCGGNGGQMWFTGAMLIDLTETFGAGCEPNVEWCNKNIPYFTGTKIIEIDDNNFGWYEFMLTYPQIDGNQYNRWKQTSSPENNTVVNYIPIKTDWTKHANGIRRTNGTAIYNCDSGSTWYAAIGQKDYWQQSTDKWIPAANEQSTKETELWVRIDNLTNNQFIKLFNNQYLQAYAIQEI